MIIPLLQTSWIQVIFLLFFLLTSSSPISSWTTSAFTVTTTRPSTITSGSCNAAVFHHAAAVVLLNGLYRDGGGGGVKSLSAKKANIPNVVDNDAVIHNIKPDQLDRREWLQHSGGIATLVSVLSASSSLLFNSGFRHNLAHAAAVPTAAAAADESRLLGSSPEHPIVVLGAGGKTGKLCTLVLAKKGLYCRATTRLGRQTLGDTYSPFVSYATVDVSNYEAVRAAIKGADGVIFAASASGKRLGGDPAHVDYLGAYNTAKACLEENVRKLVLISAGSVTRPDSVGYKALNVLTKFIIGDNIMGYKAAGEQAIRDAYAKASTTKSVQQGSYTIIRPGGLSESEPLGASQIHISQGDVFSSDISRTDLAEVAVACILKGKATDACTFELNNIKGLYKTMGNLPDLPPELLHPGAPSYLELLDGLKTDTEMLQQPYYPNIVNTFAGGSDILSIEKIMIQF